MIHVGILAFRAPRQGLAKAHLKGVFLSQTPVAMVALTIRVKSISPATAGRMMHTRFKKGYMSGARNETDTDDVRGNRINNACVRNGTRWPTKREIYGWAHQVILSGSWGLVGFNALYKNAAPNNIMIVETDLLSLLGSHHHICGLFCWLPEARPWASSSLPW